MVFWYIRTRWGFASLRFDTVFLLQNSPKVGFTTHNHIPTSQSSSMFAQKRLCIRHNLNCANFTKSKMFCFPSHVPCYWWKKSCTTWNVQNPINNGINYQPSTGEFTGFLPSTIGDPWNDTVAGVFQDARKFGRCHGSGGLDEKNRVSEEKGTIFCWKDVERKKMCFLYFFGGGIFRGSMYVCIFKQIYIWAFPFIVCSSF